MATPILYSFRRCPYAMRARLALMHCGAQCILREVSLKEKPAHMLEMSAKGTVPVLILQTASNGEPVESVVNSTTQRSYRVIEESIDIMRWAINDNPSRNFENANAWQTSEIMSADEVDALIYRNDFKFKEQLDKYKYSDRHPEHPQHYYLEQAIPFLDTIENLLAQSAYLGGSKFRFPDAAILPFIRQFSMVNLKAWDALALPHTQRWLSQGLNSSLFTSVMTKYSPWQELEDEPVVFGQSV